MSTRRLPLPLALLLVAALFAGLLTAAPAGAVTETGDVLGIVKEGVAPSNVEIAVRLSEATTLPDTSSVVIARDDRFADALASGVLQADAPMLLVPSTGPIPQRVIDEVNRLGSDRAVILGGEAAVGQDVEAQLSSMGLATERRFGRSRVETAVAIAGTDASEATTAIMARAFPGPGSADDTQAFADSLGVAAWAAEEKWPIMLTATERLSDPTREYLVGSDIESIMMIGGTAAIGQAVEDELVDLGFDVERVSGPDRFATAIEVADKRGFDDAADAEQVMVVDSQFANAWAGGLAAAAYSAANDAPIVLTSGGTVPETTRTFLSTGTSGDSDQPLACVAFPEACEQARVEVGLPPAAEVDPDTPDGAVVTPGQPVTVTIDSGGRPVSNVVASGSCLAGPTPPGNSATVNVTLADPLPPTSCELRVDFEVQASAFAQTGTLQQAEILTYTTVVPSVDGGLVVVPSGPGLDARQLASNLVGEDVQVFNATLSGDPAGAGLFTGAGAILGFDQGIVLSSGLVADAVGPNDSSATSGSFGTPGDPQLDALSNETTQDAMVLEFDFVADPSATTVAFDYVFGSEEYLEFVGSPFNDVFAFYVNDANCAMVEGGPVSINTVNDQVNSGFFRNNEGGQLNIEADGLTLTLPCQAPITPGGANHIKLAIADAADTSFDSTVFIRAASFVVG